MVHFPIHLLALCLSSICISATASIATDQSALIALKNGITSDPHNQILQNWTVSSPVCSWAGVTCSPRHHRVTALNISFMGLSGNIPPELGNLSFLTSLDLTMNKFDGILPGEMVRLERLRYMGLTSNLLTGKVPLLPQLEFLHLGNNRFTDANSIFNVSTLKVLNLAMNRWLIDVLPDDICSRLPFLEEVYLFEIGISGRIPSNISACIHLRILALSYNMLIGNIPPGITTLEKLQFLSLGFNQLTGTIPSDIGKLSNLRFLSLQRNHLTGFIPHSLFNISSLQQLSFANNYNLVGSLSEYFSNLTSLNELYLTYNKFTGVIPQSLGQLKQLSVLSLAANQLSGSLPSFIFNSSTLTLISLSVNSLSGKLPSESDHFLPILEELYLGDNNLDGMVPVSIFNSTKLKALDLSMNRLHGSIPDSLGNVRALRQLNLERNSFTNDVPELSFITQLVNCKELAWLSFSSNPLSGVLPRSIGNLSTSLAMMDVSDCKIRGRIPDEIGNLSGMVTLDLKRNDLSEYIPEKLERLLKIQQLYLSSNKLRGFIPNGICRLMDLGALYLSKNQLSGSIPECLGNVSSLRYVGLDSNKLASDIPASIWKLNNLLKLDISSNSFTGSLSAQIENLKAATYINLSTNQLSYHIPSTIGSLKSLTNLSLAHNNFQGLIPESMGEILSLVSLDLSHNNLSGKIPSSLAALTQLVYFDVSFNALSGEIPSGGPFSNFTSSSFMSNPALCGPQRFNLSSCPVSKHPSKLNRVVRAVLISLGVAALVAVLTSILIVIKCQRKMEPTDLSDASPSGRPSRFSYYDLLLATNGYSESNFLGRGGFGSVYKAVFRDGKVLAVKVFRVMGSCISGDFKAIVLEYMPNGSLEKWLHSKDYFLNLMQRLNVMIDIASALEYLHENCLSPVIHCDLKPGNVLIDENMVAHLSDFGMAKLLGEDESMVHTRTLATMGYMAPEYGSEGMISTKCDVHSFGIMLLETFTRKKPSDEMFDEDLNIKNWVRDSLPDAWSRVVDATVLIPEDKLSCICSVLELALNCSLDSPKERINMKDVVIQLKKIKLQFEA